jgi:uncharacterized membrane protein
MIKVQAVYALAGVVFAAVAVFSAFDATNRKRWNNTAFWGLFATSFLAGDLLGDLGNGLLVLTMVLIAGVGGLGHGKPATTTGDEREAGAARWGDRLFLPVLVIPAVTLVGTLVFKHIALGGRPLVDPAQVTVISLGAGVILALILAGVMLRPPLTAPPQEARRLLDSVGAAAILPQLLAALGAVFVLAGVGKVVGDVIGAWLPADNRLAVVAVYCVGMTLFTMIMGNAFAAFPVLTAGIGVPLIVRKFGGDPAVMGAIGMLAGYCGTLMTPMAAHNIVPTALLELPPGAVIRAQAPTAILVLIANIVLMYVLVFRPS